MAECRGTIYTVRKGDTLWNIAQKNGLTVEAILNANPQITDPAKLSVGQEICLPTEVGPKPPANCPGTIYTVQAGDTLYKIARDRGLTVDDLLKVNPQITDPAKLSVGQKICLPTAVQAPPPPANCPGQYYTVKAGDSLYLIAQRYGTTVDAILRVNPQITNPNVLEVGQVICLPVSTPGPTPPPPPANCPGQYYTVKAGDSLYLIAQRYGTTVDAILRVNPQITDPNKIAVGQIICIPGTVPPCTGTLYTVQAGDTLFTIARRFNVTVDAIIAANPGIDPNNLRVGQVICIPGVTPPCTGTLYTVQAGDTLFTIARKFNVTVDAIIAANPGIDPNNLRVGQVICIPSVTPPCTGTLYTVQAGDTLFTIAAKFNVTVDAIIAANPGIDPNNLRVGQVICIPTTPTPECPGIIYTIQAGDTLYNLAIRYNTTVSCILRFNPGLDPNRLQIGQRICIPTGPCDVTGKRCQVLSRTTSAPNAEGFGIYDYDANTVSALATNLPDPETLGGMVYKLFVREKATLMWQSSTMYITPDGVWAGIVRLARALEFYDLVYVSAETRESTTPVGVVVLRGDITKA